MKNQEITLENIKHLIRKIDSTLEQDDPGLRYAAVLVASTMIGTDTKTLAELTKLSTGELEEIGVRLRAAGIWKGNEVDCSDWFQEGSPGLGLDTMIARGEMIRFEIEGGWRYGGPLALAGA